MASLTHIQSALFTASTNFPYQFNKPCALNSYVPMPFAQHAVVELVNESDHEHLQYFYVDYETDTLAALGKGENHTDCVIGLAVDFEHVILSY